MSESMELEWRELIHDINEALNQIEGRHRQILSGSNMWLESLKNSPAFSKLSADKLAAVILKLEEFPIKTGDVVIRQKDPGDYFYIVKSGSLTVSQRKAPGDVALVAQLHAGDVFGEAALLSGEARNASVVADKDCMLLRLSKKDFDTLMRTDLVRYVSPAQAEKLVKEGARFLDVRRDTLGKHNIRKGALEIPIDQLRTRLAEIEPRSAYVIYCLNGNLSETAAFILSQRGYNVYALKGGQPL